MPLVPLNRDGQVQLVVLPAGSDARDQELAIRENARRIEVYERRQYAGGEQYERDNAEHKAASCPDKDRLPEHERIHAYSVQIADSIEFLTTQLAEAFTMEAVSSEVQTILDTAFAASDQFSGDDDEDDIVVDLVLRDAMIAQDVACHVRWDPFDGTAYVEVWESEHVDFQYLRRGRLDKVQRTEVVWVKDGVEDRQVVERVVYEVVRNDLDELECRAVTWWDDEPEPIGTEWLGLPFIPWCLLKVKRTKLRGTRGESLITTQVMHHADRYNANEQNAYLISRYNSHGNLGVIGDMANLKIEQAGVVNKDVADVLTFPGGTELVQITLPTDAQMIEHQREVLAEALYNCFGLTRVEPDTIEGLGSVSGYALEILNRKTEGTFRGIRREFISSFKDLCSMILDVTAYRSVAKVVALVDGERVEFEDVEDRDLSVDGFEVVANAFWEVDPEAVYPNREIEITMGSGYIVSDVMVRDDFTAGLISRRYALTERGVEPDDIDDIEEQIDAEKKASSAPETGRFNQPAVPAGDTPPPVDTKAAGTVGAS